MQPALISKAQHSLAGTDGIVRFASQVLIFALWRRDMGQMNVPAAQEITTGKSSILIGIVDSGIDQAHPGQCFVVPTTVTS